MTPEQKKFYDIKNATDYKEIGDDIDYKIFIEPETETVVLQFKESDSHQDWINNLLFLPWPLLLDRHLVWTTLGYSLAYSSAKDRPINEFLQLCRVCPGYKRAIRGWSFGSAMAKIAARHIRYKDQDLDELTTYGDVKCWLNPFYSSKKVVKTLRNYGCINDGITWCVPFYFRDKRTKVGPAFSFSRLLQTDYYHQHYEEYDYSQYEK